MAAKLDKYDYLNIVLIILLLIIVAIMGFELYVVEQRQRDWLAHQKNQQIVAKDTFTADDDFVGDVVSTMHDRCVSPSTLDVRQLCAGFERNADEWGDYASFLEGYNGAASLRVTSDNFGEIEKAYLTILRAPRFARLDKPWQGRVYEGIAYAEMRSGQFEGAHKHILIALADDPASALVLSTELKIMCLKAVPAATIAKKIGAATRTLAMSVHKAMQTSGAYLLQRDTKLEMNYFRHDDELYRMCGYAGIGPNDK